MFTFETADQKEVRRFRIAQFNGRTATVRSGGTTITGHVRSVLESKNSVPARWTITIIPSEPRAKTEKAEPKAKAKAEPEARKPEPKRSPKPDKPHGDRSTVVEDIKSDWNGPLPGFLSVSAD